MKFKKSLITLMLATCLLPALSQNIIHPKIAGPNGLWVNSYNGVLFFEQTDMETQSSVMPMGLRFYYNSSNHSTNYGYGLGFSLGYEMRYSVDDGGNVSIEAGDGRTDTYKRYGTDYEAPAGVFGKLTKSEDGVYTLTEKDGSIYTFANPQYRRLTSCTDRNGNKTELTYTDSLLTEIRDAAGHTITLTYTGGMLTSATSSFHNGSIKYEYDAKKCLKKRTDAMGNSTLYAYTKDNRLEAITDANGHKTMIAYNQSGMCSRLKTDASDKSIRYEGDKTVFIDYTAPQNLYSYYRWDEKGRVIEKVGLCCGIQSSLEYDDDDNVVKRTDANGNVTTYTYDDRGNMLSLTDVLGNTERYTYESTFNQVASFTDKNGNTYRFSYNDKGNLTSLDGPLGFSNSFTYNDKGWPLTTTDANGNVTQTTYNTDGTTASVMDAAGYTTSYTYDVAGNIISIRDGLNNTTTYAYDDNNRITSQKDALGNETTLSYDKVGNIVRVKNAKNQIRAYSYDALGNVLTMTDPMGGTYTYTYDGKGNVLSVTDPEGITTSQTWNEKNKLLSQTNGAGETTTYDYDAKGNLTAIFQPNGNVLNYFYDRLDRIEQLSDNMGVIAKYTYDGNGNQLTVTDGLDRTMTYTYDALNRKTSEALPSGATTSYEYDGNSNLLTVRDAKGNSTAYTYSSLNQQLTHTDALNAKTVFTYDANGNLSKATDAKGNATVWTYDALNRNTMITFANGASLQYSYDELGNVVASKDRAGNEFKYTYNQLGNLLSKVYPDGTSDKYTYDRISRMLSAVNKDATVNFTYDRAGRLLSETLNGKVTGYSYDVAVGKRTLTYPSGMKVEEHLNARDLISSIFQNGEEVVTMEYNVAGQKTKQTYANGITTEYGYNENGWLSSIKDDHDILNYDMTYDAVGNIIERKDLLNAERTESYGYDVISQLTSFKRGSTVDKTYEFDLLGNRVKTLENGVVTNYTSNNVNAYTNITGGLNFVPQYDGNGNMLNDDKHTFVYDYNNKLVSADNNASTYKYDALGRRVGKNNTLFYYVGDQMVEEVTDNVATSYLYGNDIDDALQIKREHEIYYTHVNHIGSTMALTKITGLIDIKMEYDDYGKISFIDNNGIEINDETPHKSNLYTGREYDGNYIYYYRARSLYSSIGRFLQHDPLLYVDGFNDYNYAINNPINYKDPSGKIVPLVAWGAVAVLASMNVAGWSTYYNPEDNSFSWRNTSSGKVGYEMTKAGVTTGISLWNPWVGLGVGANFAGWENYYDEDCGTFSPLNTTWGEVLADVGINVTTGVIGNKIGASNYNGWQKTGFNSLNNFYGSYTESIADDYFDSGNIDWQKAANSGLSGSIGSAISDGAGNYADYRINLARNKTLINRAKRQQAKEKNRAIKSKRKMVKNSRRKNRTH